MVSPPAVMEFDLTERATIVSVMAELAASRNGWINLEPAVDPADIPPRGSFRLFSVQGPPVPLFTWKPPDAKAKGVQYVSLGIQHGAGMKAVKYLDHYGVSVDPQWRVLSDAAKRGVVIAVPPDYPNDAVLDWFITAGAVLCPLPYTRWRAAVYRRN